MSYNTKYTLTHNATIQRGTSRMKYRHQVTAWDITGKALMLGKQFPSAAAAFAVIFSLPWYVRYHYEVMEQLENSDDWFVMSGRAGVGGPKP